MSPLEVEIAYRLSIGCEQLSVKALTNGFKALGYTLDRSMDARCNARYLDSGRTYPCCTTGIRETDTGRSAFHFESRRDSNYQAMQDLRGKIFSISRGAILEV